MIDVLLSLGLSVSEYEALRQRTSLVSGTDVKTGVWPLKTCLSYQDSKVSETNPNVTFARSCVFSSGVLY